MPDLQEATEQTTEDNPLASLLEFSEGENEEPLNFDPSANSDTVLGKPEPDAPSTDPDAEPVVAKPATTEAEAPAEPEESAEDAEEEEAEDAPLYTQAQMDKILALNAYDPDSSAVEADGASETPIEAPEAPTPARKASAPPQAVQIPVLDDDSFNEIMTDTGKYQQHIGEVVRATAATVYLQLQQGLRLEVESMLEDHKAVEQFVNSHEAIKGNDKLLKKAILKVRAEHPKLQTREEILAQVEKELEFLPSFQKDVQRAVKSKKVDIAPKRTARAGSPGARGKMGAVDNETPAPYNPIAEFAGIEDLI